jgi:hypothetical protein
LNTHWEAIKRATAPASGLFYQALDNPIQAQQYCLNEILQSNANCEVGLHYDFSSIKNVCEYQDKLAISSYRQIDGTIQRIANGGNNLLYSEPTIAFEVTSGSAGASKLIPFTKNSLVYLQNGIFPWLFDLVSNRNRITAGRTYWSVSPRTRVKQVTPIGISVGFDSDADYFGSQLANHIAALSVGVPASQHQNDVAIWKILTARQLLVTEDLAFVSIWSPTFILELFRFIQQYVEQFIRFVASGRAEGFDVDVDTNFVAAPERAAVVRDAVSASNIDIQQLWPGFDTLSCWMDGSAARFVPQLSQYFTAGQLQAKGLLSTEGIMSIPLCDTEDPVLSVTSGFYEFMDSQEQPRLCHELETGEVYRVVITLPNGLYRYDSGDYVKVTGYYRNTPTFRFVGRSALTSDICGEKLSDAFVSEKLAAVTGFSLLAPSLEPKPHYVLFLDNEHYTDTTARIVTATIEKSLCQNSQYSYARELGQLNALSFALVGNPTEKYIHHELAQGKILGDIKPPCLSPELDWAEKLCRH